MKLYAKIINEETGLCAVAIGTDTQAYIDMGMQLLDVKQSDIDDNWYLADKCPMKSVEQIEAERKAEFEANFFETCLGYIRRNVTMQDGTTKSFLTDLLPLMRVGLPIISYNLPDFNKEITQENLESLQNKVVVTEQFITECQNQVIIDFYGFNPIEQTEIGGE